MKIAIIQNKNFADFSTTNLFDPIVDLSDFSDSNFCKKSHEDEIPKFEWALCKIAMHAATLDVLVLSNLLEDISEDIISDKVGCQLSAFYLALHIRLHQDETLRFVPIVILSFKTIDEIFDQSYNLPQIIGSEGVFVVNPNYLSIKEIQTWVLPPNDELFDETKFIKPKLTTIQQLIHPCTRESIKNKQVNIKRRLQIQNQATSGHDVANQWGAYRMAQVVGLDTNISYPKTLYFKYLLSNGRIDNLRSKSEINAHESFWDKPLSVLYIDDNHEKGWSDCLKGVFLKTVMTSDNNKLNIVSKVTLDKSLLKKICEDQTYDLILLDYYLLNNEKGIDKLREIKKLNPVVPIIMFTASNKAWNMDDLYEAGADGYYVKEHPETAHDPEFSIKNFESFHQTVEKCLKKGELLRKYWRKIREIQKSETVENKIDATGKEQKNKERINERLIMFLGLLKKAFEQTNFDKETFFYSDWELAFLTLWSTLNEIQEACYEKDNNLIPFQFIDRTGLSSYIDKHPGGSKTLPRKQVNWKIKGSRDNYLTLFRPKFDNNQPVLKYATQYDTVAYSKFSLNDTSSSGFDNSIDYKRVYTKNDNFDYSGNLYMQIAFLVNCYAKEKNNINANYLLRNTIVCNDLRNKLYLTHGDDSSSPNFYEEYKKHRRTDTEWKKHTKELFEIVYFLCTGKDCDWSA